MASTLAVPFFVFFRSLSRLHLFVCPVTTVALSDVNGKCALAFSFMSHLFLLRTWFVYMFCLFGHRHFWWRLRDRLLLFIKIIGYHFSLSLVLAHSIKTEYFGIAIIYWHFFLEYFLIGYSFGEHLRYISSSLHSIICRLLCFVSQNPHASLTILIAWTVCLSWLVNVTVCCECWLCCAFSLLVSFISARNQNMFGCVTSP